MIQTCRNRVVCPGSDSPFANLSSEANDPALFLGVSFCWDSLSRYPRLCFSDVSQPEALLCAENLCVLPTAGFPFGPGFGNPPFSDVDPPQTGGGVGPPDAPPDLAPAPIQDPPGSGDYIDPPQNLYVWNTEQTCTVCIPSGPCYTYVCVAGTFYALGP